MHEQYYAYAKQAGIKDNEIDYSSVGSAQILPKLVATLEAGYARVARGRRRERPQIGVPTRRWRGP
jgi:hypothetical protein